MKTSFYYNLDFIDQKKYKPIAISGDEGKLAGFKGKSMPSLSPYPFYKKWKENDVKINKSFRNGEINTQDFISLKQKSRDDYIAQFYNYVLKPLNPNKVYQELGDNCVLLCFEKPNEFCHRFLVASWLELTLGIQVNEYGFEKNLNIEINKELYKQKLKALMEKESDNANDENQL